MLNLDSWDMIGGMMSRADGLVLYDCAYSLQPASKIVEIGCYEGKSTIALLQGCADSEPVNAHGKRVMSVDNFSGDGMTAGVSTSESRLDGMRVVRETVERYGLSYWFEGVSAMTSDEWFADYTGWRSTLYDMFFIDGYHQLVKSDMLNAWHRLKPGGVLLCHDYHPDGSGHEWVRHEIDAAKLGGHSLGELMYKAIKGG